MTRQSLLIMFVAISVVCILLVESAEPSGSGQADKGKRKKHHNYHPTTMQGRFDKRQKTLEKRANLTKALASWPAAYARNETIRKHANATGVNYDALRNRILTKRYEYPYFEIGGTSRSNLSRATRPAAHACNRTTRKRGNLTGVNYNALKNRVFNTRYGDTEEDFEDGGRVPNPWIDIPGGSLMDIPGVSLLDIPGGSLLDILGQNHAPANVVDAYTSDEIYRFVDQFMNHNLPPKDEDR